MDALSARRGTALLRPPSDVGGRNAARMAGGSLVPDSQRTARPRRRGYPGREGAPGTLQCFRLNYLSPR
jgi:hypothetical protein